MKQLINSQLPVTLIAAWLLLVIGGVGKLSAQDVEILQKESNINDGLAINIIQQDREQVSGYLIDADRSFLVFENDIDTTIQIISRTDIKILETNMDINLLAMLKDHKPEALTDIIEMNDGTRIVCIILDVSAARVQYFTGNSLRRQLMATESISVLHLNKGSIDIPFPIASADKLVS